MAYAIYPEGISSYSIKNQLKKRQSLSLNIGTKSQIYLKMKFMSSIWCPLRSFYLYIFYVHCKQNKVVAVDLPLLIYRFVYYLKLKYTCIYVHVLQGGHIPTDMNFP